MFHLPESRFTAFGVHLLVSATLFCLLFSYTYFFLLPGFLFYAEGGQLILSLIGGIDVVLGPLVTLIIYNKYKRGMKFDLCAIALIQIGALLYGLHSMYTVRPLAVFYAQGEFHIAYATTFAEPTYSDISNIKALHAFKTPIIAIELPEDQTSLQAVTLTHILNTGESYFAQEALYSAFENEIAKLRDHAMSPQQAVDERIIAQDSALAKLDANHYGVFSFISSLKSGYMVLNLESGKFVAIAR